MVMVLPVVTAAVEEVIIKCCRFEIRSFLCRVIFFVVLVFFFVIVVFINGAVQVDVGSIGDEDSVKQKLLSLCFIFNILPHSQERLGHHQIKASLNPSTAL